MLDKITGRKSGMPLVNLMIYLEYYIGFWARWRKRGYLQQNGLRNSRYY